MQGTDGSNAAVRCVLHHRVGLPASQVVQGMPASAVPARGQGMQVLLGCSRPGHAGTRACRQAPHQRRSEQGSLPRHPSGAQCGGAELQGTAASPQPGYPDCAEGALTTIRLRGLHALASRRKHPCQLCAIGFALPPRQCLLDREAATALWCLTVCIAGSAECARGEQAAHVLHGRLGAALRDEVRGCCAALCCAVLCCVMLCCAAPCCAALQGKVCRAAPRVPHSLHPGPLFRCAQQALPGLAVTRLIPHTRQIFSAARPLLAQLPL